MKDTSEMQAILLAGGRGTRLGELTGDIPKPMIKIGGKPVLQHQVELLVKHGIHNIILLVNYLKDPILEYFKDGKQFNARISYFEEEYPLGTAGGLKEIESMLTGDFLVLYGDVMINMDISTFIRFHQSKKSQCTLVLHPNDHPYDSDLVDTDDEGKISGFFPKPHKQGTYYHNLVNAGAYILSPDVLRFIEKGKKADFGRDVFPTMLGELSMYGYQTTEYLKDMGTPERLNQVNHDYHSGRINRSSYEYPQRAVFLDRDGVLNIERSYISKPEELVLYDFTAPAVRKLNQTGFLSVVVTNQSAVARNLCTEEDVRIIHKKMETTLGEQNAWLDAIYYCPHHPDKGFPEENPYYKIECECRKPGTGMFKKAIERFHIDPRNSYMIGDSERDIQSGINAGCTTIGVRTGYGLRKSGTSPDYMFNDLAEAIEFIVDDPLQKYCLEVCRRYKTYTGERPWIILIGGNARTGKSTLASYLRLALEKSGHSVLQVTLDNWLLPENQRTPSMNVYDRFQLNVIEADMMNLLSGKQVYVSSYSNHPERISYPVEYNAANVDIIIIEGVVALSSAQIRQLAQLRLFTTLPAGLFRKRIADYYEWRGKSLGETESIVEKRELDEYQLIEKESNLADLIINSSVS